MKKRSTDCIIEQSPVIDITIVQLAYLKREIDIVITVIDLLHDIN